jgi:hypothetical protein
MIPAPPIGNLFAGTPRPARLGRVPPPRRRGAGGSPRSIPQPNVFLALIHGRDGECPCCRDSSPTPDNSVEATDAHKPKAPARGGPTHLGIFRRR